MKLIATVEINERQQRRKLVSSARVIPMKELE